MGQKNSTNHRSEISENIHKNINQGVIKATDKDSTDPTETPEFGKHNQQTDKKILAGDY